MIEKVLVTLCLLVIVLLTLAVINKADCAQTAERYICIFSAFPLPTNLNTHAHMENTVWFMRLSSHSVPVAEECIYIIIQWTFL